MENNNFKNLADLNEELSYRKSFKIDFNKDNETKYTLKAKKYLLSAYTKYSTMDSNVNVFVGETLKEINSITKNDISKVSDFNDIVINKTILNKKTLKDLKQRVSYFEDSSKVKVLLEKERVTLISKKERLTNKIQQLESDDKTTWLAHRTLEKKRIENSKNNIRLKDVDSFIKNKTIYRKVYLSDEPKLTPSGWVKLFLSYGLMLFWAAIIIWPLYELVKATTNNDAISTLRVNTYHFGFDSFNRLFDTDYVLWIKNTLLVAGITSVVTVFLALLMGYAFSRFRFKGKKPSLLTVMILQMIPTMAALTVFYVLYTIMHQNYGISGLLVLMLIYIGGGVSGNTFIMKGYIDSISVEIDEAAKIDGLSQWKIFTRIIVPLTKPMIALVALWSFIGPFGDYILPGLLLSKSEDYTVARGLRSLINNPKEVDQAAFAAGAVIIAVPISLLFISLRNFLVGGMTSGGVKG